MKTLVAVARREIQEKRFVIWAALAAAVVPFAVPAVLQLRGGRAQEVRDITAVLLGLGIPAAVAAGMGSSIFAGELAARRMSFLFSRPISAFTLWAGKLAGALILIAIPFVLIQGPTAWMDHDRSDIRDGIPLVAIAGALLAILLLVNHLSTMIRSRSWIGFVDLAAILAIGIALGVTWTRLRRWSYTPPVLLAWVVGAAATLALLVSSYRAVAWGRTSLKSTHAALSASLWAGFGGITVALVGYAAWVLATPPQRLVAEYVGAAGPDGWVFAAGRPRGAQIGLLYNTRSSRFERVAADDVSVSGDGRVAAWVERANPSEPGWILFTRRLDLAASGRNETRVSFQHQPFPLTLSPDGSRVAAVESGLLTISEIETGRTLASARIGMTTGWRTAWFTSPDRVRVVRYAQSGIESIELDAASHAAPVVHSEPALQGILSAVSVPGDRLVFREYQSRRVTLRDARTLEKLATLYDGPSTGLPRARFLQDGSIALAVNDGDGAWLDAFSSAGVRTAHVRLGDRGSIQLGEQPGEGRMFLSFHPGSESTSPSGMAQLLIADLRSGTVSRSSLGLHPLSAGWFWPRTQIARPGSESSRLFVDERGGLVRFDPATGERKLVLGG